MTTIACDGKSMAGDTLCTANGSVVAYHRKIERLSDGRIVGSCGYIAPMAIGSGGDYAIGAMLAGQDPVGAVEIAMIRDRNTGGDVETYSLEPTLKAVA